MEFTFDEKAAFGFLGGRGAVEEEDRIAILGVAGELEAADGSGGLMEQRAVAHEPGVAGVAGLDDREFTCGEALHVRGEVFDRFPVRGDFHFLEPIGGKLAVYRFGNLDSASEGGERGNVRFAIPNGSVFRVTGAGGPIAAVERGLEDKTGEAVGGIARVEGHLIDGGVVVEIDAENARFIGIANIA